MWLAVGGRCLGILPHGYVLIIVLMATSPRIRLLLVGKLVSLEPMLILALTDAWLIVLLLKIYLNSRIGHVYHHALLVSSQTLILVNACKYVTLQMACTLMMSAINV